MINWDEETVGKMLFYRQQKKTIREIASILGGSAGAVQRKLVSLGHGEKWQDKGWARSSGPTSYGRWNKDEDQLLAKMITEGLTNREMGKRLGRTIPSVQARVITLRLSRPQHRRFWTEEEKKRLTELVNNGMSQVEASHTLGRPIQSVHHQMKELKLTNRVLRRFTPEEDDTLVKDFYAYVPVEDIAAKLGRNVGVVRQRIFKLELRRDVRKTKLANRFGIDVLDLSPDPDQIKRLLKQRNTEMLAEEQTAHQAKIKALLDRAQADIASGMTRKFAWQIAMVGGCTLQEIGDRFDLTRERVRQIVHGVKPTSTRGSTPPQPFTCAYCGKPGMGHVRRKYHPECAAKIMSAKQLAWKEKIELSYLAKLRERLTTYPHLKDKVRAILEELDADSKSNGDNQSTG